MGSGEGTLDGNGTRTASRPAGWAFLRPGTHANHLFRFGLLAIGLMIAASTTFNHYRVYPFGVDLEIPLRAVARWLSGDTVYQAAAFQADPGATQPFLYPPYVLPLLAPLVDLPRQLVKAVWFGILLVAAVIACRRLAIPPRWMPVALIWPPFSEGLIGGNVQILLLAVFAYLFFQPEPDGEFRPRERDIKDPSLSTWQWGLGIAVIAALKVSQFQPGLFALRHRPLAALVALGVGVALAVLSVAIVGIDLWFAWLEQLRRATDPTWELGGIALPRYIPGIGTVIALALSPVAFFLPRHRAGLWIGVISVVGATSLHPFGILFLIPAMLVLRRELTIVGAMLIATNTYAGTWAGILVIAVGIVLALRWKGLEEPPASLWEEKRARRRAARSGEQR